MDHTEKRLAFEKAMDLFARKKYEEAVAGLISLIDDAPDFTDAYETLSRVYYKLNRLDDAIQWMEKLAQLNPAEPMVHTNLSIYYMKKGDKVRAEEEKAKATVLQFSKPK